MVRSERQNREVAVRNIRIGVVEDDPASCQLVLDYLNRYQQENDEQFTVSVFDDGARIVEKYTPVYDTIQDKCQTMVSEQIGNKKTLDKEEQNQVMENMELPDLSLIHI